MKNVSEIEGAAPTRLDMVPPLLELYGCGSTQLAGTNDALFERHLLFDTMIAPAAAGSREEFQAAARSVRDILAHRWIDTESTYEKQNPKRVYYLSMQFLIGRSLSNNVMSLLKAHRSSASLEILQSRSSTARTWKAKVGFIRDAVNRSPKCLAGIILNPLSHLSTGGFFLPIEIA
jgi:hypothetical protein